jgi:hypothetical protein
MLQMQVEALCTNLLPLTKNLIRTKILKYDRPPKIYTFGEAVVFWLGDLLTGSKLVTSEQLRLLLEEFSDQLIYKFGNALQTAWVTDAEKGMKRLPSCKIGFLDRQYVCMDGIDFFLNLTTGETTKAVGISALETVAYNLTTLFVRYQQRLNSKSVQVNSE